MKLKNIKFGIISVITISVITILLSFFGIFQKLDYRSYDTMLKVKKEPLLNEKIAIVACDDASINLLGEWPWGRDVIADVLLRLKEFNASTAIFDIEYLTPSSLAMAPGSKDKINQSLFLVENDINQSLYSLGNSIGNGSLPASEVPEITSEMINTIITLSFTNLNDFLQNNIYRDNDEYFGQCIQFFDNVWLTVNMRDLGFTANEENNKYIFDRLLLDNINDEKNLIGQGNLHTAADAEELLGFTPSIQKLVSRAKGVSFTNSTVDSDGTRRRIELLSKYQEKYVPQLVFGSFLKYVDSNSIKRTRKFLTIHNAKIPGTDLRRNINIPLDDYGRMLINYRKGTLAESIPTIAIAKIHDLDSAEMDIINCLNNIFNSNISDDDGYPLECVYEAQNILNLYDQISAAKNELLEKCQGYDQKGNLISGLNNKDYADYFTLRSLLYDSINQYIHKNYIGQIEEWFKNHEFYFSPEEAQIQLGYFYEDFSNLEEEYNFFTEQIDDLKTSLNDRFCIIGNTSTSTTDIGATPVIKQFENVGIHANVLNTLMNQDFFFPVNWIIPLILSIIVSILLLLLNEKPQHIQNLAGGLVIAVIITVCILSFILFDIYIPLIGVLFYLIVYYISNVVFRFLVSNREKKFITMIAASFANKDTVDELRKNPETFKAGGQKKNITALFSDIQKFSTFSEKMDSLYGEEGPSKLIEILNEYLGDMSKAILYNNGTIDKYEGDAIISMFGAPDINNLHDQNEWAYYSLDSAIRMKKTEEEFNKTHFNPEDPEHSAIPNELHTRIGLNSGAAFVGLMGSKTDVFNKLNYTMIGDTVNLASRLEGVNKAYNTWIMCSDSTWNMANSGKNEGKIAARKLDQVRVVGKSTPVQLYNILGFKDDLTNLQIEQLDMFNSALDFYFNKDFVKAGKLFVEANKIEGGDPTSIIFAERCKNFIEKGLPENWDGVINMTSK